jgi:hypothetical protein
MKWLIQNKIQKNGLCVILVNDGIMLIVRKCKEIIIYNKKKIQ